MTRRVGASRLGCLATVLVVVAIVYFGVNAGQVYLRYWRFRDAAAQQLRFAAHRSDAEISAALHAKADSLGLPAEARRLSILRTPSTISISSAYTERIDLSLAVRDVPFTMRVEGSF